MSLRDHTAPGSSAGVAYQFFRALYWLAISPAGYVVGIETNDDVTVVGTDGTQLLEQDKHSITADTKPFGNRSRDLWNTLAIWLKALDTSEVYTDTTHFLMVTNKPLPVCIARFIHEADTEEKARACVLALEEASQNPPQSIAHLVGPVLDVRSRHNLLNLILNCELSEGSSAPGGSTLRNDTIAELQLPEWHRENAESIFDELVGWIHSTAIDSWSKGVPAWIHRDHFVNRLHTCLESRRRRVLRERAENLIPVAKDAIGEKRGNTFVKQLHLVLDDSDDVDSAIRDYIRCNIEKSRLSSEGNIGDDEWIAFEAALLSRWSKIRSRVIRMRENIDERLVGFEILTETTESHREKLAGFDTEQVYLTSGTYHRLADLLRVGWHPRFESFFEAAETTHD